MVTIQRIRKMTIPYYRIRTTHPFSISHSIARIRQADNMKQAFLSFSLCIEGTDKRAFPLSTIQNDSPDSNVQDIGSSIPDNIPIFNIQSYRSSSGSILILINDRWKYTFTLYKRNNVTREHLYLEYEDKGHYKST
jgi:hypothetical protein